MKTFLLLTAAMLAAPQAASAAASATTTLFSNNVAITFSSGAPAGTGELFSRNSASFNASGITLSDNEAIPGVADAPLAVDGPISADSIVSVAGLPGSFNTNATGTVDGFDFGSAGGNVTGSFDFTNAVAGLVITIVLDYTRSFDLSADLDDTAVGRTALSFGIRDAAGTDILPTLTLTDLGCDPNATFSAANGATFTDSCSGTATFTFDPLVVGDFTLSFGGSSNIDVVADQATVPAPAALALFGLGLAAVGLGRRR